MPSSSSSSADSPANLYHYPQYQLLVFAKSPILGTAKTRLQPILPPEFSLELHRQLVSTVLRQWSDAAVCPIACWVAGDKVIFSEDIIVKALPDLHELPIYVQKGNDLGERLAHAIAASFSCGSYQDEKIDTKKNKQVDGVLVVGTDCPFIDKDYLKVASEKLIQYDVVIGPADDGGYVLLGLKAPSSVLFKGINWGSSSVFDDTLAIIKKQGLSYYKLPVLSDIDHPEDLEKLRKHGGFSDLLHQADELISRYKT